MTNEAISAIKICGLDPYLGVLHEISYGRPVEMKPQLYKTFLAAYEQIMQGPAGHRSTIQAQVRSLSFI